MLKNTITNINVNAINFPAMHDIMDRFFNVPYKLRLKR